MLGQIKRYGCLDCWVACQELDMPLPHHHDRSHLFKLKLSSYRSIKFPSTPWWPFCYLCWVPFRAPCLHPSLTPNRPADPGLCPYGSILPDLLVTVYLDEKKRRDVFDELGEDVNILRSSTAFFKWLGAPSTSAAQVPNPHRFLLAFWTLFKRAQLL
jgi:hypothetical protein